MEKAIATHSSTLAWKIPCTEGPGRLQSMGSWRVRHSLSNFTFTFHFHALEKKMATHSSALAWRIPGTAKPGGLPSMGSHRVGHGWSDLVAATAGASLGVWGQIIKLGCIYVIWASLVVQKVKNLPAMQETLVWSLGWEDPLEEGIGTHSSILAWRTLWTEEPGRL